METKKVFEETEKLDNKLNELNKAIKEVNAGFAKMMEQCPHELVFKLNDNHPRKMMIDGKYYCPACGKVLCIINEKDICDTPFKDAKIVPLSNLSLIGTRENYETIREEVMANIDMYYDPNANIDELSQRVEGLLVERQYDFLSEKKLLKKR